MTDAGWAGKKAVQKYGNKGWHIPYAAGLVSEHARAIRIVKAEIKRVKKETLLRELQALLSKFERGRGGKG